tara:strand:+ start:330 stop:701 length:372 start_codon:yes stop_codon:yes gene_type:complete
MKITKQRLKQIIKEEFESSKKKGLEKFTYNLKTSKEKGEDTSFDVEKGLDYFFQLINSPDEVVEFMSLLDDALIAATEEGKFGSVDNVKKAIVGFIRQIAPRVSVEISTVDMFQDEPEEENKD